MQAPSTDSMMSAASQTLLTHALHDRDALIAAVDAALASGVPATTPVADIVGSTLIPDAVYDAEITYPGRVRGWRVRFSYLALLRYADRDGIVRATQRELARATRQSERSLTRVIQALVDAGWVERVGHGQYRALLRVV